MTQTQFTNGSGMWRAWIVPMVLIAVALVQIMLTKTDALCPWKGGGFGMFSTTDATAVRNIRVFIDRPLLSEELEIAPPQELQAVQAKLFPSERMLAQLASAIATRELSYKRQVNAVRLEVWRTEFRNGSLEPRNRLVRTFRYPFVQSAD